MRDERGIGGHGPVAVVVLAAALATLTAPPATAQYGFLQLQYQGVRGEGRVLRPDSTFADTTFSLSSWIQHYQFNQAVRLSPVMNLSYQVGYQDQRYVDRTERTQIPYGRLQVVHPVFGVTAQVRPVWATFPVSTIAGNVVGGPDSSVVRQNTQQSTQSILSAYVGGPRSPRVEGSWIRNQRQANTFTAKGASDQRDIRASYATGPWALYAGYGDLANSTGSYSTQTYQRNYRAGAAVTTEPWRAASLTLNYDWTRVDYLRGTGTQHTLLHRFGANGFYRQSTVLDWNLSTYYSVTQQRNGRSDNFDTFEGSLFANYHPNRTLSVNTGGGMRKVYLGSQTGFERYLSASGNLIGRVRPGWDGVLTLNETVFWNPLRDPYHVTSGRVGSNFILREGVWANIDASASVNTDTILAARTSRTAGASLNVRPLSSFQLNFSASDSRSGRDFGSTSASATTADIRVLWSVLQSLEISGSLRGQRIGPGDLGRTNSKSAYVRWLPTRMSQLMFTYDRSEYRATPLGGASSVQERESMTLQGIWNLDRSKQVSAEGGWIDPDTSREAQTFNATFTWRFGR